ncbi:hypothetical protein N7467_002923 [Penicillium canescens]|nr:hypothetical protein N7467_002923 [Penicillium canescens]
MEYEDFRRPFRFIVTGHFIAIHYNGSDFELHRDRHSRGTLFHLSDDDEQIIYNRTYIGNLTSHPDYPDDVFYIQHKQQYLSSQGKWTDSIDNALKVQIAPEPDWGDPPPTISPLASPVISADNLISADGIDLYQPDQKFLMYPIGGLWMGNAEHSPEDKLVFRGNPYSDGLTFELSVYDGKTRIVSDDGMFLTVIMPAGCAEYLDEECRQHTASTRCPGCERNYTIGFVSEPRDCITLVPRGLPSMFVFYDGVFYYHFDAIKGSYAELERVERIEDASLFQFVGFLS